MQKMDSYSRDRVSSSRSEREYSRIFRRNEGGGGGDSEDIKIDRKTKQLFDDWSKIERRAEELR